MFPDVSRVQFMSSWCSISQEYNISLRVQFMSPSLEYSLCPQSTVYVLSSFSVPRVQFMSAELMSQEYSLMCPQSTVYVLSPEYSTVYVHRVQLMVPEYSLCPQSPVYVHRVQLMFPESTVYVRRVQYSFCPQRTVYVLRVQLMFPEYSFCPQGPVYVQYS